MRGRALGPGKLVKRGHAWTLLWTDECGKRRRKVLSTDRRAAERIRTEIIRRRDMARAGLGDEAGQELPLAEIAELYLEELRTLVSPRHYKNTDQRLHHCLAQLDGKRVRDLRAMDLTRIRSQAVFAGSSHRTANLLVDRIRVMLNWAVDAGVIALNPVAKIKRLPETADHQKCKRRALSEAEKDAFLHASRDDDEECELIWSYPRVPQTIWWQSLLEIGGRYKEMRLATWGDLDLNQAVILLRAENTKSKKQRLVPLRTALVEKLRALKAFHENVLGRLPTKHDFVFLTPEGRPWPEPSTNPNRILRRVLKRAGIRRVEVDGRKIDLHALRHTCNSRMAVRGVPLEKRQRILGHSDPKLTAQVYTHMDAEDLRDAVAVFDTEPQRRRDAQ